MLFFSRSGQTVLLRQPSGACFMHLPGGLNWPSVLIFCLLGRTVFRLFNYAYAA